MNAIEVTNASKVYRRYSRRELASRFAAAGFDILYEEGSVFG